MKSSTTSTPATAPLPHGEIVSRLNAILEIQLSFRDIVLPSAHLASLQRYDQEFVLDWTERVASTSVELGYRYLCHVSGIIENADQAALERWALAAMDKYDSDGLRKAIEIIESVELLQEAHCLGSNAKTLADCESVITHFVRGLSGRPLSVQQGDSVYTDTETLYLPQACSQLPSADDNFVVYKITAALLWAQTRYGSFRRAIVETLLQRNNDQLTALYNAFESCRLEARIQRELPGLYRDLKRVSSVLNYDRSGELWNKVEPLLTVDSATAELSLELAERHLDDEGSLSTHWLDSIQLSEIDECMQRRMEEEKLQLRESLKKHSDDQPRPYPGHEKAPAFHARLDQDSDDKDELDVEIVSGDETVALTDSTQAVLRSIMLDIGYLPDDYLQPAEGGEGNADAPGHAQKRDENDWHQNADSRDVTFYPEWDYRRQDYRKNWCAVREQSVQLLHDSFVRKTLNKYRGLVSQLRKTFEAMRDEDHLLKRQSDGSDVDIDALVDALVDAHSGSEMSDRLYFRMHRGERTIAVVFMIDMSGSTKGWINDAERESLVLLCESLEALGDRYAIYGFSSVTRKRCNIFHIKHFDERYDETVRARISGIEPQDYTRMGFAIRHLTQLLQQVDARTRVLITLSDGKPDDYDHYRGEFGIEDTRRALIEARHAGIHPYCITIDKSAPDYLPHLYGPAAYTMVKEVRDLPNKISDIYRRLTT